MELALPFFSTTELWAWPLLLLAPLLLAVPFAAYLIIQAYIYFAMSHIALFMAVCYGAHFVFGAAGPAVTYVPSIFFGYVGFDVPPALGVFGFSEKSIDAALHMLFFTV